jgi:hypothetical protein
VISCHEGEEVRKVTAAMIAPVVIPALFFLGKMIVFDETNVSYLRDASFETFAGILPFGYLFSFAFGVPAVIFLSKIGRLTVPMVGVGGVLGGLLSVVLVLALTRNLGALMNSGFLLAVASALGLVVACVFCALAKVPIKSGKVGHEIKLRAG